MADQVWRSRWVRTGSFNTHYVEAGGGVLDRRAAELEDDVAGLEARLAGRAVFIDGRHEDPLFAWHLEVPGELPLDRLVLDSQLAGAAAEQERAGEVVLVPPEAKVLEAEIVRTSDGGRYPSDHFPVTAAVVLPHFRAF